MLECLKKPDVMILIICQALGMSLSVIIISSGGTIGLELSGGTRWSTLPITTYVLGVFIMLFPASWFCGLVGRKRAFTSGALCGILGGIIFYLGIAWGVFWLVCAGTLILGFQMAFVQYYRFAVTELVDKKTRAFALSLVIGGSVFSAFIGPWLVTNSRILDIMLPGFQNNFSATAMIAASLSLLQLILFILYRHQTPDEQTDIAPKTSQAISEASPLDGYQRRVFMAFFVSGISFALMVLLMNAAPVAMQHEFHLDFEQAVSVVQWHVFAMFFPSFFTGYLIKAIGTFLVSTIGILLFVFGIIFGVYVKDYNGFLIVLIMIGIGWNFCYLGGSYLLVSATPKAKKSVIQGMNDAGIYFFNLISSLLAGVALAYLSWAGLNSLLLLLALIALLVVLIQKPYLRAPV